MLALLQTATVIVVTNGLWDMSCDLRAILVMSITLTYTLFHVYFYLYMKLIDTIFKDLPLDLDMRDGRPCHNILKYGVPVLPLY